MKLRKIIPTNITRHTVQNIFMWKCRVVWYCSCHSTTSIFWVQILAELAENDTNVNFRDKNFVIATIFLIMVTPPHAIHAVVTPKLN